MEKLYNEELNDLYSSPLIFRLIKPRKMRWTGHVGRMGDSRVVYRGLVGNLRERNHLEEPGENGRIIVRWIFKNWDVVAGTGSIWLRIRTGGGNV